MNKMIPFTIITVFALMTSCKKKNQTCTCNYTGNDTVKNKTIVYPLGNQTDVSAQSDCDNLESTLSHAGAVAGWDCHI